MKSSDHVRPTLSRAEWNIMNAVWKYCESHADFTVSELLQEYRSKKWTVSTIKTMLQRLVGKGVLDATVRGRTCFYRVLLSREDVTRENLADYLDTVLEGTFGPLVAYLADRRKLNDKEIQELENLIEKHHKRQGPDREKQDGDEGPRKGRK